MLPQPWESKGKWWIWGSDISGNFWEFLTLTLASPLYVAWVLPLFNKWPHSVNVQNGIMVAQHLYGWGKHLKLHDQTRQQHVQTIVQFLSKECQTLLLCLFLLSWHCGLVDKGGKGCWIRQDRTETNRGENNQLKVRQAGDLKAWLIYKHIYSDNVLLFCQNNLNIQILKWFVCIQIFKYVDIDNDNDGDNDIGWYSKAK